MGQTYPLPITAAMVAPANQHAGKPRYIGGAADWHGGAVGNDIDVADTAQAIANSGSAQIDPDYEPRHQEEKAEMMVPPLQLLADLGKDYGAFTGLTGRTGTIEPLQPYPKAEPEVP